MCGGEEQHLSHPGGELLLPRGSSSPHCFWRMFIRVGCPQPELRHPSLICAEQLEGGSRAGSGGWGKAAAYFMLFQALKVPGRQAHAVSDSFIVAVRDGRYTLPGAGCRAWGSSRGWRDCGAGRGGKGLDGSRGGDCHQGPPVAQPLLLQDVGAVLGFQEDFQLQPLRACFCPQGHIWNILLPPKRYLNSRRSFWQSKTPGCLKLPPAGGIRSLN